jgi:hypothetical protein
MMHLRVAFVLLLALGSLPAHGQVPHILCNWQLNLAASRLPGPAPPVHVRRYSLAENGTLIGLAVVVDARGEPSFLQFAAKPDGKDYPEFDARSAGQYLIDGSKPPATYAETPLDSHTVDWVDKYQSRVIARGKRWVSADGQTLSITALFKNERNEEQEFLFVFDRL